MAAEWKEMWTLASAMIARQPPPMQIFIWLGAALALLMFVEGLRVSFLPRRPWEDGSRRETRRAQRPSTQSGAAESPEPAFVRAQWLNATRKRKLADPAPRRHRAFRPKIRRVSSSFEMSPAVEPDQFSQPDHLPQSDDQLASFRPISDYRLPASESESAL